MSKERKIQITDVKTNAEKIRILRRKQVENRTGLSRSTIYDRLNEGTFPKQISLGPRTVGWVKSEIDAWLVDCIKSRDDRKEVA